MLDIPLEDLLSLLVVIIAVIINLVVATKSYRAYKANKLTQTILFALTALFMALAMTFLVGEKIFLSSILQDEDMGVLFGSIAIILSGFTVAAVDAFAFNMAWPTRYKKLTLLCAIPIIVYLSLWLFTYRDVLWEGIPPSGEIVVGPITTNAVYFTLVPLLIIPVFVFFYYALKVRNQSPISSKRSWLLGLGVMTISFAYIFEIIGLAALLEIAFLPTIVRIFFSIGALLMYWALFKIKAK